MGTSGQKGIGIIEVLVALAIVGATTAAMMSLINEMVKSNNLMRTYQDRDAIFTSVETLMTNLNVCGKSVKAPAGFNPNGSTRAIIDLGGGATLETNKRTNNFDVRADLLEFRNPDLVSEDLAAGTRTYRADLYARFATDLEVVGPNKFKGQVLANMLVTVNTSAGNSIKTCSDGGTSGQAAQQCTWTSSHASNCSSNASVPGVVCSVNTAYNEGAVCKVFYLVTGSGGGSNSGSGSSGSGTNTHGGGGTQGTSGPGGSGGQGGTMVAPGNLNSNTNSTCAASRYVCINKKWVLL